jgi:hypothetical protein
VVDVGLDRGRTARLGFVVVGLIGTGLGYWGLCHWREFADRSVVSSGRQ